MRPDSVVGEGGEGQAPEELLAGTRERGYKVCWAPKEEVLKYQTISGFWTHSGWNSTLEMCWSNFADQMMNSRLVSEVWKLGIDMKDRCDRVIIEKMIRDLMGERKVEFMKSATEMADLPRASVNQGGSSYCSLDRLIDAIRRRSLQQAPTCELL
ncbi:7-deoxyloganetic acid UDP-glucosyltransferase-like protein [Prunus yedoensis var. nudiflora]|uniref:7-deoxyloganetic acid UDP-glucosyltransferase-like protein n=1 Tax=Prunus yedoensis var. nudiflora TaxID=2094558 RepID=A0A314XKE6_PRUYE|nr:7-deoxyloganetic acid UDP-glucosyltransferase-like protein [Prunus yedoensis var. nudiflora]